MTDAKILHVIPNVQTKKSLFKKNTWNIVVYQDRLLFALLTAEMIKKAAEEKKEELKAEKANFLKKAFQTATIGYKIYEKYYQMGYTEILTENTENFELFLNLVKKTKFKMGDFENNMPNRIILKTDNEKYLLEMQDGGQFNEAKKVLNELIQ